MENRMTQAEVVASFLRGNRNWNGGAGLIVPEYMARGLAAMGIVEGYTVQKPLPKIGKEEA